MVDRSRPSGPLKPLPSTRFELPEWKVNVGVNIDYHFEFQHHFYSVPYPLVGKRIDVRATAAMVEAFHKGRRVASHQRSRKRGGFTTDPAHRPDSHRRYAEWTPSRLTRWAEKIGPNAAAVVAETMRRRPHPEQGFRSCLGLIRLSKRYSPESVEAACQRARAIASPSYRSVRSILKNVLEKQPLLPLLADAKDTIIYHDNIRGPEYYQVKEDGIG